MLRSAIILACLSSVAILPGEAAQRAQQAPPSSAIDRSRADVDDFPSTIATDWFELLYDVVRTEKTTPPPASRNYALTAVALYEAIVPGTRDNRSLVGQLNDLTVLPQADKQKLHWPTVANSVLARTIRGLYPSLSQASTEAIDELEADIASQQQATVPPPVYERSVEQARAVADAILNWAASDGFATYNNCAYAPAEVTGAWQPTPPTFNPNPLQPCWGLIRPMVLTSGQECAPAGPPAFSTDPSSDFYGAAREVYDTNLHLTDEQKAIANHWADNPGVSGTPPGHWIAIVSQIAELDGLSLGAAAEAYVRVGLAVNDAFIVCWNAKYLYNLQRPVTYVNDHIDATWSPYLVTPVFPTYISGHSTQSSAAARVLTDMFGIKSFTDQARSFDSFDSAAAEAALSRLYAGIHFSFDNDDGITSGRCVGDTITQRVSFQN